MSTILKKPFIKTLFANMSSANKTTLHNILDRQETQINASVSNLPLKGVYAVKFKMSDKKYDDGILIYTDTDCVLFTYKGDGMPATFRDPKMQIMEIFEVDTVKLKLYQVKEYCTIDEFRNELDDAMDGSASGVSSDSWVDKMKTVMTVDENDDVSFQSDIKTNFLKLSLSGTSGYLGTNAVTDHSILTDLINHESNVIYIDNEIYTLQDKNSDSLVYTHVGRNLDNVFYIKSVTIYVTNDTSERVSWDLITKSLPHLIEITNATSAATTGTFTVVQMEMLESYHTDTYISFNNELYYLADEEDELGYDVYSHVGRNNGSQTTIKSLYVYYNENASNYGTWALTKVDVVSKDDFDALKARVAALEAAAK